MIPFYTSPNPFVWLLALTVIVPFFAGLWLLLSPKEAAQKYADTLGLLVVSFCLIGAAILWVNFHPAVGGYSFLSTTALGLQSIGARMQLGLNALSLPMFFLTALIGCAAGYYAYAQALAQRNLYWSFLLLILGGLLGAFASVDIFYAFLFHETALLPIFFSLMIFGGADRKKTLIEAGVFMLAGSLPLLVGVINYALQAGPLSFSLIDIRCHLANHLLSPAIQIGLWVPLFLGTAILSGLWPFYGWVPKILTQTPTPISMLIGGALKLFGVYFLLQAFVGSSFWGMESISFITGALCAINVIWLGILAFKQTDFQWFVALGAVMHLGGLFMGLSAYTSESLGGVALLMFATGLTTALLLMLSGSIERRAGSLEMLKISGLRKSAPRLSLFLMLGILAMMALPGTLNFWGEFSVIIGAFRGAPLWAPSLLLGLFITAGAGLKALRSMLMGPESSPEISDLTPVEKFCAWILVIPLVLFGIVPSIITNPIAAAMWTIVPSQL